MTLLIVVKTMLISCVFINLANIAIQVGIVPRSIVRRLARWLGV